MIDSPKELWPCLDKPGLDVFTITADQRFLLGEETFLETHFPISLRRFRLDSTFEIVSEDELLWQLLDMTQKLNSGNRVWILYGAAGSGKSELMKWLQIMILQKESARAPTVVRLSRTDLDVLSIVERFHHLLTRSYFDETTHRRWEQARRKPRTLAKLLVLTALERCLDADEQINALYYRLLDWIQPRITRSLALTDNRTDRLDPSVEILSREDLEQLRAETVLPVPLDYEQFRHHLLVAFRDHLLEGINLPQTLRLISEDVSQRRGVRPVLLIDDLVQSVNLFATDLLDYFITLEGGDWDVVVGLTPASLESSARGRELLDRITYLDTIDDRVQKLWLSDMQGYNSYFLTEANCHEFTGRYLSAYRALNGWACGSCPHQARCADLDEDRMEILLAPLNRAALLRVFRGLPEGKGKARHLLGRLRAILAAVGAGENPLDVLRRYAQLDTAFEESNRELTLAAELYGPPAVGRDEVTLPGNLLRALGLSNQSVTLRAEPLVQWPSRSVYAPSDEPTWMRDADKTTVKAWLENDSSAINRQSLLPLRRGLARWLRSVCPVDALHAEGIARPRRALRWRRTHLATRPPVQLEGIDEYKGILLQSDVGHAAFDLYRYAKATGDERTKLSERLIEDERLLPALFAADDYHGEIKAKLEIQLGMSAAELALALYVLLLVVEGPPDLLPPGFGDAFWTEVEALQKSHFGIISLDEDLRGAIRDLFDDFFKLRENVYDGPKIAGLLRERTPQMLFETLASIDTAELDKDYRIGGEPLNDVLNGVQETLYRKKEVDKTDSPLSPAAQTVVEVLMANGSQNVPMNQVPTEVWTELQTSRPDIYEMLHVSLMSSPSG